MRCQPFAYIFALTNQRVSKLYLFICWNTGMWNIIFSEPSKPILFKSVVKTEPMFNISLLYHCYVDVQTMLLYNSCFQSFKAKAQWSTICYGGTARRNNTIHFLFFVGLHHPLASYSGNVPRFRDKGPMQSPAIIQLLNRQHEGESYCSV